MQLKAVVNRRVQILRGSALAVGLNLLYALLYSFFSKILISLKHLHLWSNYYR